MANIADGDYRRRGRIPAGSVAVLVASALAIVIAVFVINAANNKESQNRGTPDSRRQADKSSTQKPSDVSGTGRGHGIDLERILRHMTSESNTVIFFNDRGEVASVDDDVTLACMRNNREVGIISSSTLPTPKNMRPPIMFTWSASGIGRRYSRSQATAILEDCIRIQSRTD